MQDLSLHILDIAENAIAAGARSISILVLEDTTRDVLTLEIVDDGRGMSQEELKKAVDPFVTTKLTRKVGLGLPLLNDAAKAANGNLEILSTPGVGTRVIATFQHSHVDRKPLGSLADTITALVTGCEDLNIVFVHERGERRFVFDTKEVREELADSPLHSAKAMSVIRGYLNQEEESLIH
jgi:signal transduction histidine kinase